MVLAIGYLSFGRGTAVPGEVGTPSVGRTVLSWIISPVACLGRSNTGL